MSQKVNVIAYQCPDCKEWIYARCSTDFRSCSCGTLKLSDFVEDSKLKRTRISINASRGQLYDDYIRNVNYFGKVFILE